MLNQRTARGGFGLVAMTDGASVCQKLVEVLVGSYALELPYRELTAAKVALAG